MLVIILAAGLPVIGYSLLLRFFPSVDRTDRLIVALPAGAGLYTLTIFCLNQASGFPLKRWSLLTLLAAEVIASAGALLLKRRTAIPAGESTGYAPLGPLTPLARIEIVFLIALLLSLTVAGIIVPIPNWDNYSEYYPLQNELFRTREFPREASPAVTELIHAFPPGYIILATCGHILNRGMLHLWSRAIIPPYALLILCLLFRMGRRHLPLSLEALLAALLLCASLPLFANLMTLPHGTIILCFYALAGLYFILEYCASNDLKKLLLAGIMLGMGYWTSYTATVIIPCMAVALGALSIFSRLAHGRMGAPLRIPPTHWGLFFIGIAAVAAPHLIRNAVFFKNPVYPALYQIFGGTRIDEWSVKQFLVRLVPAHGFFLRPRWEIFHEGFFVQLLFVLSLLSQPWYRRRGGFMLALFCVLYDLAFLAFFTWPRTEGISTKLLLPSLIPACLFAGERITRILRREIPWIQAALILALIPIWSAVMLRDEILFFAWRAWASWLRFLDCIQLISALCIDFDEILIWIGVALCLITAFPLRLRSPGMLASAILLLGLTCRPLSESVSAFAQHVSTAARDGTYSFWNASVLPWYFPEAGWLDKNLPRDTVIGTFDNRTYLYPRRALHLDSHVFWPVHRQMDMQEGVAFLKKNGITHLCLADFTTAHHPFFRQSPVFGALGDPRYMPLIYQSRNPFEPDHELKVYEIRQGATATPANMQ